MLETNSGGAREFDSEAPAQEAVARRVPPLLLFLVLLAPLPVIALLIGDFRDLDGTILKSGHVLGRDFVNVWTGGRLVAEGKTEIVYSLREYLSYQQQIVGPIDPHYYSYPPSSLFVAAPFGWLPYLAALAIWLSGTLALFLWSARPYVKDAPGYPLFFAALTPAALVNIWAGHYGFLLGALWLACFAQLKHAPARAGTFAALMTIKPHLGLLLPPLLLARRAWRTILVASLGTVALVAASGWTFGFELWHDYLTKMSRFQASLLESQTSFYLAMMPGTFTSIRYTLHSGEVAAWMAHVAAAIAAAFLCWRAERLGAGWKDLAFIAATATFLILPYAFNYDMTVVSLGFALMLFRHWDALPAWKRIALIGGYLSPQLTFASKFLSAPVTPAILLFGLFVQVQLSVRKPS